MRDTRGKLMILAVVVAMIIPTAAAAQPSGDPVEITLLHTNDFHGRLQSDYRGRGRRLRQPGGTHQRDRSRTRRRQRRPDGRG